MEYFGADGDRMHMMFNFQVNQHLFYALASADTETLKGALKETKSRPSTAQWEQLLEATLAEEKKIDEMLTHASRGVRK